MESISRGCILPDGAIHLLIDSTGLKVFGAGEWLQEKHGAKARRTWKKPHLAVDADTGMVMDSILTGNDVGDPPQVAPLLDQIDATIASVTADGAYGRAVHKRWQDWLSSRCLLLPLLNIGVDDGGFNAAGRCHLSL